MNQCCLFFTFSTDVSPGALVLQSDYSKGATGNLLWYRKQLKGTQRISCSAFCVARLKHQGTEWNVGGKVKTPSGGSLLWPCVTRILGPSVSLQKKRSRKSSLRKGVHWRITQWLYLRGCPTKLKGKDWWYDAPGVWCMYWTTRLLGCFALLLTQISLGMPLIDFDVFFKTPNWTLF